MRYLRVYNADDGRARFEAGWTDAAHPAPARQWPGHGTTIIEDAILGVVRL